MLALCFPNFLQRESLLAKLTPAGDSRTVTLWAPISIRKRDCRKLVLAPEGMSVTTAALRRQHRHRHGQGRRPGIMLARPEAGPCLGSVSRSASLHACRRRFPLLLD
jgi:hypothetical protein